MSFLKSSDFNATIRSASESCRLDLFWLSIQTIVWQFGQSSSWITFDSSACNYEHFLQEAAEIPVFSMAILYSILFQSEPAPG